MKGSVHRHNQGVREGEGHNKPKMANQVVFPLANIDARVIPAQLWVGDVFQHALLECLPLLLLQTHSFLIARCGLACFTSAGYEGGGK